LTIDRVIGVGLPYHHRKIMTTKVAYGIAIIVKATTTFLFVRPFGFCQAPPSPVAVIAVALPMFGSVILTVITNGYLYYVTVQSNRKLQQNLKLSERDKQKINRLRRLVRTFQTQAKPTLSVLILGGTDCAVNVLWATLYALAYTFFSFWCYKCVHQPAVLPARMVPDIVPLFSVWFVYKRCSSTPSVRENSRYFHQKETKLSQQWVINKNTTQHL